MKALTVLFFLITVNLISYSQELKFKIEGIPDTTVHLVKYVGSKLYYADTAQIKKGMVRFDGSKQEPGILAVLLPGQRYFEFIYNDEEVYIETKSPNFIENMVVKKSKENKIFLDYIREIQSSSLKAKELNEQKSKLDPSDKEGITKISSEIDAIGKSVTDYQKNLVKSNPSTFVAKVVRMSSDVVIPEPPKNPDGSLVDSSYSYKYLRDHYFENIDFSDDRLVNTPVLQKKLEYYYSDRMLLQHPDTLIKYLTRVVDSIPEGSMMYRFFVTNLTSHFEKSKIMGMDKVMNVFVDRYYCARDKEGNPKGYWMDSEKLDDLCKDTKTRLRLVQGVIPPNIILPDSTNIVWHSLYDIDKEYIILYFWDPNCGHCKKETPKLQTLYDKKLRDRGIEIFAVGKATGDDFEAWKKFIRDNNLSFINVGVTEKIYQQAKKNPRELIPSKTTLESLNYQETYDIFSTPRVWVLDADKKIIAKSLSVAQLERLFDRLQDKEDLPKIFELESESEESAE
ncbi:MAG: thioredoxin-like domain-containing protein [Brumimicrobium sp.]|nr:thioredoxin-like domain-containing protein [Brumimicrobium sp.]